MTLIEFLAPAKTSTSRIKLMGILSYGKQFEDLDSMTVKQIQSALKGAGVANWRKINISDVLIKAGHFVHRVKNHDGIQAWKLTKSGEKALQDLMLFASSVAVEKKHDVDALRAITDKVANAKVKEYIKEAELCLEVDALRACVVFIWTGAIHQLHERMLHNIGSLSSALQKHDPKGRNVTKIEDFAYVKDITSLLAATTMGILDKSEKDTLEECLNLRNRCGHPGSYKPGAKKVSSMIEDLTSIIFMKS